MSLFLALIPKKVKLLVLLLAALVALYFWFGYWLNKQNRLAVEADRITITNEVNKRSEDDAGKIESIFENDADDAISKHVDELFIDAEQASDRVPARLQSAIRDKTVPRVKREAERDESTQNDSGLGAQNRVQPEGFTDTEQDFILKYLQ